MSFQPVGLPAGIGSLPFLDANQALSLIEKYLPEIPHWPQLPRRGSEEGFIYQFLNPLVETGLISVEGDRAYFDTSRDEWPERLTEFYSLYLEAEGGSRDALNRFAFPHTSATGFFAFMERMAVSCEGCDRCDGHDGRNRCRGDGNGYKELSNMTEPSSQVQYVKGQLAGPLTIGLQLKDDKGRYIYYDEQLRDVLVKTLAMHARWQAVTLGELGFPVIIFIDEPGIRALGQFSYITVTREMILEDMKAIFDAARSEGAVTGVHSCDAIDWSVLFDMPEVEIVSFDAYGYFKSLLPYKKSLKAFVERGGVLAWGIVPTSDAVFEEDMGSLVKKMDGQWEELVKRGIDMDTLSRQALITPSCGAGLLSEEAAERIYRLAAEVSGILRERAGW